MIVAAFATFALALPGAAAIQFVIHSPGVRSSQEEAPGRKLAPYVPTPHDVVERMLELARVTSRDFVVDLGCGDGRIPIAAAKKYGARALGVDLDPARIEESKAGALRHGVSQLVTFRIQHLLEVDVSEATVVALYLSSSANRALRPILTRQLKPGARIVSHTFGMGDWKPAEAETWVDARGETRTLYLWRADGTAKQ